MPHPVPVRTRRSSPALAEEAGPVVPFPAERRTADVRRCAGELDGLNGEAARLYWQRVCRALADELLKLGSSETDMRAAVFAFQDEVQRELIRRHETGEGAF